jgi:hypothetical protein
MLHRCREAAHVGSLLEDLGNLLRASAPREVRQDRGGDPEE